MVKVPPAPFLTWDEYRKARDEFYLSSEWRELRKQVIQNSDGRCVYCKRIPTKDNPINIDHRIPLCKNWDLRLSLDNLQLTCHECNKKKSGMSHKRMLKKMNKQRNKEKKKVSKKLRLERKLARRAREQRKQEKQKAVNAAFWATYLR